MALLKNNLALLFTITIALIICLTTTTSSAQRFGTFNNGKSVLIRNGNVVDEFNEHHNHDLLIIDGKIAQISKNIPNPNNLYYEIDATDKIVMPGGIDPHVHISMPFCGTHTIDDWYYASRASISGGTTTLFDFILPIDHSLTAGVDTWKQRIQTQGTWIDYSFHVAVTGIYGPKNLHPRNNTLDTLAEMYQISEDEGITSFKFFLAYKNALMIRDDDFLVGLHQCSKLGAIAMVHAENGDAVERGIADALDDNCTAPKCHWRSRPAMIEAEATNRAAILAQFADAALYVVHVQSKGAVEAIQRVRETYKRVVGEAVVSGFTLDERDVDVDDFDTAAKYVMSPPFHIPEIDGVAIKNALQGEDILQTIGTDHATFTRAQKRCVQPEINKCSQDKPQSFNKIPNGVNGIEERMAMSYSQLVHSGMINLSQFVRLTSTNAARVFGIYPQKGSFAIGSDADIIIFDHKYEWAVDETKQHMHPEVANVFNGMSVNGKVVTTLQRGDVLYQDEEFCSGMKMLQGMENEIERGKFSRGKFIPRNQFSSSLYHDVANYKNNGEVYVDADGMLHVKRDEVGKKKRHDEL